MNKQIIETSDQSVARSGFQASSLARFIIVSYSNSADQFYMEAFKDTKLNLTIEYRLYNLFQKSTPVVSR